MTEQKSLRDQFSNWCRHFNGIGNDRCEIGVIYDVVCDPEKGLPCLKEHGCAERCLQASFLTDEELDVKVAQHEEIVRNFMAELFAGKTCPHCHAPIEKREQIGRCIYVFPCGHRLGQGTV